MFHFENKTFIWRCSDIVFDCKNFNVHFFKVASAVQSLQKTGRQRLENLRTLRQAFSQGTAFIDTFFK